MGICCSKEPEPEPKLKSSSELFLKELEDRHKIILPGEPNTEIISHILRDQEMRKKDKLKPSVSYQEYKIESFLKPQRITTAEWKKKSNRMYENILKPHRITTTEELKKENNTMYKDMRRTKTPYYFLKEQKVHFVTPLHNCKENNTMYEDMRRKKRPYFIKNHKVHFVTPLYNCN